MLCDTEKSSYLHVKLSTPSYHTISTSQAKLSRTIVTIPETMVAATFPFTTDNNQPPTSTTHADHVSTLHDNSALELSQGDRV